MEKPKKYKNMMVIKKTNVVEKPPLQQNKRNRSAQKSFSQQNQNSGKRQRFQKRQSGSSDSNIQGSQGSAVDERSDTFGESDHKIEQTVVKANEAKDPMSQSFDDMSQESTSATQNGRNAKNNKRKRNFKQVQKNVQIQKQNSKPKGRPPIVEKPQQSDLVHNKCQSEQCLEIIQNLRSNTDQKYLSEFLQKIQHIGTKIQKAQISNTEKFATEMRIVLSSLLQQFLTNQRVYPMVMSLLSSFEKLFEQIDKNLPFFKQESMVKKIIKQNSHSSSHEIKPQVQKQVVKPVSCDPVKPLTSDEIQSLANSIRCLNREQLMGILQIMKDGQNNKQDNKQLQFDVGKIPIQKQRELQQYIAKCNNQQNTRIQATTQAQIAAQQYQLAQMQQLNNLVNQNLMQNIQNIQRTNNPKPPQGVPPPQVQVKQPRVSSSGNKRAQSNAAVKKPEVANQPIASTKVVQAKRQSSSGSNDSGGSHSNGSSGSSQSSSSSSDDENFKKLSRLKKGN